MSERQDALEERIEALTERADPFMAWLGVVFALLVGFELAVDDIGEGARFWLEAAGWAIWAVFVLEFGARLVLAPAKGRFLRRQWLTVVALAVPTLRLLRFVRLLRLGRALPAARVATSSYRSAGTAKRLVRSRLGYLGAITVVAVVALAELAYLFERGSRTFDGFGDALVWSATVVVANQADPVPSSAVAQALMLAGFAYGLVVVAALAGTIGAYLVEERRERAARDEPDP